jgi:2',3'-cyclic-nucleotide 2'-phosphodiesterase/3'-nucleotidase
VPLVANTKSPTSVAQTSPAKSTGPTVVTSESASKPRDEYATTKPAAKEERKAIPVKLTAESSPKADSKKTYLVAKGDTPLSIAKKYKVPFDDLLATNKIDDPHKLKIGQKLVIPVKKTKPKKAE